MIQVKDIQVFYFHGFNSEEQSSTFNRIKAVFPHITLVKYNFMEHGKAYKEIDTFLLNQVLDDTTTVFYRFKSWWLLG